MLPSVCAIPALPAAACPPTCAKNIQRVTTLSVATGKNYPYVRKNYQYLGENYPYVSFHQD